MLAALRNEALAPLLEGGCWAGVPGHSTPFRVLLGRINGLPDDKIEDSLKRDPDPFLSASSGGAHCEKQ